MSVTDLSSGEFWLFFATPQTEHRGTAVVGKRLLDCCMGMGTTVILREYRSNGDNIVLKYCGNCGHGNGFCGISPVPI